MLTLSVMAAVVFMQPAATHEPSATAREAAEKDDCKSPRPEASGVHFVHPTLGPRFKAFAKGHPHRARKGETLAVLDVLFVRGDQDLVFSRTRPSNAYAEIHNTVIEYVDGGGRVLFTVLECREPEAVEALPYHASVKDEVHSMGRVAAERSLRAFLLSEGYEPVLGVSLGRLTHVRYRSSGPQASVWFRIDGTEYRADSPPFYKLPPKGPMRENLLACGSTAIWSAASQKTSVVLSATLPVSLLPTVDNACLQEAGVIRVSLDGSSPFVKSGKNAWTVESVAP